MIGRVVTIVDVFIIQSEGMIKAIFTSHLEITHIRRWLTKTEAHSNQREHDWLVFNTRASLNWSLLRMHHYWRKKWFTSSRSSTIHSKSSSPSTALANENGHCRSWWCCNYWLSKLKNTFMLKSYMRGKSPTNGNIPRSCDAWLM